MAPARGFSQSLADRLFVGGRGIDFRATVSKAAVILESVTTLPDLLRRFATTIGEAVGTDSVTIYLAQRKVFRKSYPSSPGTVDQFKEEEPLVQWLATHHEPLILEELHRVRATATTFAVRRQLEASRGCGRGRDFLTRTPRGHHASRAKALRPHLWQHRAERAPGAVWSTCRRN